MSEQKEPGRIYSLIPEVAAEIGAVEKGRTAPAKVGGYSYRGIDDALNAVHQIFAKKGIFPVLDCEEVSRETRKTAKGGFMTFTTGTAKVHFYASDGSFVTVSVPAEGMDSGDKSGNKLASNALKVAIFTLFTIPTEGGLADSEGADYELGEPVPEPARRQDPSGGAQRQGEPAGRPEPVGEVSRGETPKDEVERLTDEQFDAMRKTIAKYENKGEGDLAPQEAGVLAWARLCVMHDGDVTAAREKLRALSGKRTMNDLSSAQMIAIAGAVSVEWKDTVEAAA